MLILARREGERVVIGGDVTVTVMEISGQTVRLGIAGPDDLPIYREEIWLAVQAENQAASESVPEALLKTGGAKPAPSQAGAQGPAPVGSSSGKPAEPAGAADSARPATEPAPSGDASRSKARRQGR